jgi:hypothetical protein
MCVYHILSEIVFEDEASGILTLCEESDTKDEVPVWEDVDCFYAGNNY